jgi:hypothetical protein
LIISSRHGRETRVVEAVRHIRGKEAHVAVVEVVTVVGDLEHDLAGFDRDVLARAWRLDRQVAGAAAANQPAPDELNRGEPSTDGKICRS